MSNYKTISKKDIPENVITINEGQWKGVQYIIRNINIIDTNEDGNNISFEYDLISDLGDNKRDFEIWFHEYIQNFLIEAMNEYVKDKDTD
jgi:hypothetical protein